MKPDPSQVVSSHVLRSLEIWLTGRVQGVGFRYFALEVARRLGLAGYVMNTREGAVQVYAEGPRKALEQFLRVLQQGPAGAQVREVRTTWGVATGTHSTFTIQPTL